MGSSVEGDDLRARAGELRRLTIMFSDVVGSTELSGRLEPEAYRELMGRYRAACRDVIESRYEGHIVNEKGDGTLSIFGFPVAHENDAERAVRAGLALVRAVHDLSAINASTTGEPLDVRVAVHHGPVYLDFDDSDIYGLAANVGSRLHSIATPGTLIVSEEVQELVGDRFEIEAGEPQRVKGLVEPLVPFAVVGERRVGVKRRWSTPLVERERERELLQQTWRRVVSGADDRVSGMLVWGDAGLGKSRLVADFSDQVRAQDGGVVELPGSALHVDAGFHPVRTLAEARCGIDEDSRPAERLERLTRDVTNLGLDPVEAVPLLAPVLDIDPSAGYEPPATEGRKLEEQVAGTALRYVIACTRGRPAIIVAEDLHWFDDASRELLVDLMRSVPPDVLVVGTSRDRENPPWETIELSPLTLAGRLALIDALVDEMTEEERLGLARRSDGVPLYVEELARANPVHQAREFVGAMPMPGTVPEVLYEPLVARLYATRAALPVAATVAAAGQEIERSLLTATMSIPADELDSTLRALVDARVLESVEDRPNRYRFRHELLREVAYELQPPSWRRKAHSRICDFLAREDPGDWRVLASQFERAERFPEAANAYQQTAELARRRGALAEARAHLTRALELLESLPEDPARAHREVGLRLRRGFLAMSAEGAASEDASADFERCIELASGDPGGDDMFSTLISVWAYYLSRAELDRARQVSTTLRAALGDGRDYFRPQNLAGFGMLDWFGGSFARAIETLTTAVADLERVGRASDIASVWFVPSDATCAMHTHLGLARFMAADIVGAVDSFGRSLAHAASLDFPQGPWSAAYANWLASWMWVEAGRLDLAGEALDDLRSSAARHGFDSYELIGETHAETLEGIASLGSGADAASLSEQAEVISALIEFWEALGLRVFVPFYLTTAGALHAASGVSGRARELYDASLRLAHETGMHFYDAETARRRARLASERDTSIAELRAALHIARKQAACPFELRIALDLHQLLDEEARPLVEQALLGFDEDAVMPELDVARALI